MNITLLITATICPHKVNSNVYDVNIRKKQYKDSLEFFIIQKNIRQIVLCENNMFDFSEFSDLKSLANKYNKEIEFISFKGDYRMIQQRGKGYGEGELIKYAFKNSRLLRESEYFIKITGRLKVKNISKIINGIYNNSVYMKMLSIRDTRRWIDTRFYCMPIKIYNEYFLDLYKKVEDSKNETIEKIFYDTIIEKNLYIKDFCCLPNIVGISGGTGGRYNDNAIKYIIKNLLYKFKRYSVENEK